MSNIHKNFNSRTRVGATKKQLGGRIGLLVSIHAPVWVRPVTNRTLLTSLVVSIHAPVWVRRSSSSSCLADSWFQFTHPCGCDLCPQLFGVWGRCFNSRTRVGATVSTTGETETIMVSIHAPVWVRPYIRMRDKTIRDVSIHAPVWVRLYDQQQVCQPNQFQFTHPCGCDACASSHCNHATGFNSRTRVGATLRIALSRFCHTVSIHAPVWVRQIRDVTRQDI